MKNPEEVQIIQSEDGSHTLFIPSLNETYHSTHGAIQESEHVFIQAGLAYFSPRTSLNVLEVGFGTGLNAFLSLIWAKNNQTQLHYTSLEAYPVKTEIALQLNYSERIPFEDGAHFFRLLHESTWDTPVVLDPNFTLEKRAVKLEECQLEEAQNDLVFFDAFAPSRQADMWTVTQLEKCYKTLKTGGILVSYCANGQFKRNLKALGFTLEMLPGPPGKREMTRAIKC